MAQDDVSKRNEFSLTGNVLARCRYAQLTTPSGKDAHLLTSAVCCVLFLYVQRGRTYRTWWHACRTYCRENHLIITTKCVANLMFCAAKLGRFTLRMRWKFVILTGSLDSNGLVVFLFIGTLYCWEDHVTENEVGGTRSMHGRDERCIQDFGGENQKT
jgi:hypothetical protein